MRTYDDSTHEIDSLYTELIDEIDDSLAELYPVIPTGSIDIICGEIVHQIYNKLGEKYAHCDVVVKEYIPNPTNKVKLRVNVINHECESLYSAILG